MTRSQIAATLYTVRDRCGTAAELAACARKLRAIGYQTVQHPWSCPVPPREAAQIYSDEGLVLCSSHEPAPMLLSEPERAAQRMRELGVTLTAFPYPQGIDFSQEENVRQFSRQLRRAGEVLRAAGLTLGYHNHDLELRPFGAATVLDFLLKESGPDLLVGELDTYWVHVGGGDCVAWCRKLRGRMPFIHLKDHRLDASGKPMWTEIGNGTLPFGAIVAEAERSGCRWFIVEQDTCPGDPFDSLRTSFNYLAANIAAD